MTENLYTPDCIRTVSGKYVNVFEPTAEMIDIEDIAHALSHQCRFGGHLPEFYSVAQHSVLCAKYVPEQFQLAALMHDASEAYLLDIPRPIKQRLTNYKEIENKLMLLIAEVFGFEWPMSPGVAAVDEVMLKHEWDELMLGKTRVYIVSLHSPVFWKRRFLQEFERLKGGANG